MSQNSSSFVLKHLDNKMWDQIAAKTITNMTNIHLSRQTNKVFGDFVFMENKIQQKQTDIPNDLQITQPLVENLLPNFNKIVPKQSPPLASTQQQFIKQTRSQITKLNSLNIIKKESQILRDSFNRTIKRVYTEPLDDEEINLYQERMRKIKGQRQKYRINTGQSIQKLLVGRDLRGKSQMQKVQGLKQFTYDYSGKIIQTKKIYVSNPKFTHIKTKLFYNEVKKSQKLKLHRQKMITQISEVKKILNNNNKTEKLEEIDIKQFRNTKNYNYTAQSTLLNFFKDKDNVEMGVTITDSVNKSKLQNKNLNKNDQRSMKLNEFKQFSNQNNKSLSQSLALHFMKKTMKSKQSMINQPQKDSAKKDSGVRLKSISMAESNLFSSYFSRPRQHGNISIKNESRFSEYFQNYDK